MKTLIWLDDVRNPHTNDWLRFSPLEKPFDTVWLKSYKAFTEWITENGLPDGICFDHDLADFYYNPEKYQETVIWHEKTGYDCAKWVVDYCIDNEVDLPKWYTQSANEVGKENIDKYLINYMKSSNS